MTSILKRLANKECILLCWPKTRKAIITSSDLTTDLTWMGSITDLVVIGLSSNNSPKVSFVLQAASKDLSVQRLSGMTLKLLQSIDLRNLEESLNPIFFSKFNSMNSQINEEQIDSSQNFQQNQESH